MDHSKALGERGNVQIKAKITYAKHSDISFPHMGQFMSSFEVLEGLLLGIVPLHSKFTATPTTFSVS